MPWKGPYVEGVSQTMLNRFLVCPYRFYIYAILGLEEPRTFEPNLIWGDTFHKGLEHLISLPTPSMYFTSSEWDFIDSEIDKHLEQYVPFPPSFPISIKRMLRLYDDSYKETLSEITTEVKFSVPYKLPSILSPVLLRGKFDGVSGNTLIEHKCKGRMDVLQAREETPYDLQINLYALVRQLQLSVSSPSLSPSLSPSVSPNPLTTVIYDIIKIPDTNDWILPKRRMSQTVRNWVSSWYDTAETQNFPIIRKQHLWLTQFRFYKDSDDLLKYFQFTINPLLEKLIIWWEWVTQSGFDHENPKFYNDIFYKTPIRHFNPSNTENYKCEYYNYLTDQISLDELKPVHSYFPELV